MKTGDNGSEHRGYKKDGRVYRKGIKMMECTEKRKKKKKKKLAMMSVSEWDQRMQQSSKYLSSRHRHASS